MVCDAVIRNLEIIGEAAKNVPDEVRAHYPEIAWRKIAGLRDVPAQGYFGLEPETIWDIVQNKVPLLKTALQKEVGRYVRSGSAALGGVCSGEHGIGVTKLKYLDSALRGARVVLPPPYLCRGFPASVTSRTEMHGLTSLLTFIALPAAPDFSLIPL